MSNKQNDHYYESMKEAEEEANQISLNKMKAMKIISYVVCGVGLLGGLVLLADGDTAGGVLAMGIYGFFLAFTINK